jgi:hypothetical protein
VLGRGYVEKPAGSRSLRDTEAGVDVVLAGEYPGDGKPKAVAFPIRPRPPFAAGASPSFPWTS